MLKKKLLKEFDDKVFQFDSEIKKAEIVKQANEMFQQAEDFETIITHMQNPIELERQCFEARYLKQQKQLVEELRRDYDREVRHVLRTCHELINQTIEAFEDKGQQRQAIETEEKIDFLQFLFCSLIKDLDESLCDSIEVKRETVEGHRFFELGYSLPNFNESLFTDKFDGSVYSAQDYEDDSNQILLLAPSINTIDYFLKLAKFVDQNLDSKFNKHLEKKQIEFFKELDDAQKARKNYEHAENHALGCRAQCFFCGARCTANQSCEENKVQHKTNFHRPMAFKGSHEIKSDKKFLLRDFCTSEFNLNRSKWPRPPSDMTQTEKLLRRLSDEHNLETEAMNLYLEWSTGSDLDINVMCGCGNWHGYGTSGGSEGSCKCETCFMYRDHDIMCGDDGRTDVFEHVYFKKPDLLYGKTIGMQVHNYSQNSSLPENKFKMALINRNGF